MRANCREPASIARVALVVAAVVTGMLPASATAFSFTFEWGPIPSCTDGYPNRVPNPVFTLADVPAGTVAIEFEMVDRHVPDYYHGGGTAAYTGQGTIAPGAFEYKSPCPPRGTHTYEWTAVAKDAGGARLGEAKAARSYPE